MKLQKLPKYKKVPKHNLEDYIGWRFGTRYITGRWKRKKSTGEVLWETQCSCGSKAIYQSPYHLFKGNRTTCRSCRPCSGKDGYNYKGTEDIPRDVLGRIERGCRHRNKDIKCYLSLEDLQEVWSKQEGLCALSGLPIVIKRTASVDRIDSDGDYTIDNVQFVHKDINKLKMDLPEEYFRFLCTKVANYGKD